MCRQRIDLEMHGRKGNRQRIWEALRALRESFTVYQVCLRADANRNTVRKYLQALIAGGYVEVLPEQEQTWRLVRDSGAEAPALRRDGSPSSAGKGTEAMWRTLRIVGEVTAADLAAQASISIPTNLGAARCYLMWLKRAGYVQVLRGQGGEADRYRLTPGRYSGPRAPMIQRIGQVFDPNLGEVVYRQPAPEVEL